MGNLSIIKKETFKHIDRVTFNNGMVLLVYPYNKVNLVSTVIIFKAGSIFEGRNLGSGLSHFVEHMAFKGTTKRTSQDFINEISKCGGYINAYTTYERTVYYTVVKGDYHDLAYEAVADAIVNSTFDTGEFSKEKEVVIKEMERAKESPQEVLWDLFCETALKVHPYRIPVGGYIDKIKKLTRDNLVNYYRSFYIPERMCICIAGNVDTESIVQKTLRFFTNFFKNGKDLPSIHPEPHKKKREISFKNLSTIEDNVKFILGYNAVDLYSPDLPKLDVLSAILGSGRSSKLVNRLVFKENIAQDLNVSVFSGFYPGFLYISGITKDIDSLKKIYNAISDEFKKLPNTLQKDEMEKIKNFVLMTFFKKRETVQDMAMLTALAQFYYNDPLYDEKYVNIIKKMEIDDIIDILPKYIRPENETISFVAPIDQKVPLELSF